MSTNTFLAIEGRKIHTPALMRDGCGIYRDYLKGISLLRRRILSVVISDSVDYISRMERLIPCSLEAI